MPGASPGPPTPRAPCLSNNCPQLLALMPRLNPDIHALSTRREALVLKNLRECRYSGPLCCPLPTGHPFQRSMVNRAAESVDIFVGSPVLSSNAREVGQSPTDAGCCSVYILDYTSEVEVTDCVGCQIFLGASEVFLLAARCRSLPEVAAQSADPDRLLPSGLGRCTFLRVPVWMHGRSACLSCGAPKAIVQPKRSPPRM